MINPKNWKKLDKNYQDELEKYGEALPSREFILKYLTELNQPEKINKIIDAFGLPDGQFHLLKSRIKAMIRDGQLQIVEHNKIIVMHEPIVESGKVFAHANGYGFFIPDSGESDGFIPPPFMAGLMHGDLITAKISHIARDGRKEYEPIEIIKRATTEFIGKLIKEKKHYFVVSDHRKIIQSIYIPPNHLGKAKVGEIVRAKIITYPNKYEMGTGQIIQIVGNEDSKNIHNKTSILNYQLPDEFPNEVLNECAQIPDDIWTNQNHNNRRDLRDLPFVTIDGADARDFDDAVCAKISGDNCTLYVAIADVAYYVCEESALNDEAYNRGTSIYFPNQVIPMLPEKLSNGLCSLNPNCDRLAMVCTMTINPNGEIIRSAFSRAIIHSHLRLTYELAEEMIFKNKMPKDLLKKVTKSLSALKETYQRLLKVRKERHALNFDFPEPLFEYDNRGKIKSIVQKKRLESHQLIEECMVAANICAAKLIDKHKLSALFRVHFPPEDERQKTALINIAHEMGLNWENNLEIQPQQVEELLNAVSLRPDRSAYEFQILRLMNPACYLPENSGHFGLALKDYCHFTSPIRRYPDITVHRAIIHYLNQIEQKQELKNQMVEIGRQCSELEKRADEVSREVVKRLKCEYLSEHPQSAYSGKITRITDKGLFVLLDEILIDGLIHIKNLADDYYLYDEEKECLIGRKTKKTFRLGDELQVKILNVSPSEQQIDLQLITPKKTKEKSAEKNKKGKKK